MESLKSALAPRAGSATALAELLSSFRTGRRARATGLHGAARGYALTHLARALKRSLVCVEPDEEAAEALERDLRFFWPQSDADTAIVRLPGDEVLPYEGLTPDPQGAMARLSGLFHLHLVNARVVVLSVRGLARRVLPREALDSRSLQLAVEATQDRDELATKLTAVPSRKLAALAARAFRIAEAGLPRRLADLGRGLGAPWGKDQKEAAAVAWVALASS